MVRTNTNVRVRFADTDSAGIVHYAKYLAYLEVGRAEALRAAGVSGEMIVAHGLRAPVLEAALHYRAPARFDDQLEITAWVSHLINSRFRWAYEIRREPDQVLILTAETLHAWTDLDSAAEMAAPKWLADALGQLCE